MSRVERRLTHEAMYTGLGSQPAESVFPNDVNCRALDAGNIAGGSLEQLCLETFGISPAQIHPEQHFGPILGFGAAGAGLNVDERIVCIHFAAEHPAKFELGDLLLNSIEVCSDILERGVIVILSCKRVELAGILDTLREPVARADEGIERRALLAERLRPRLILPNPRIL